jgi:hypothetical protein
MAARWQMLALGATPEVKRGVLQIALEHRRTSGELLDQSSNQAQEFLLLRSVAGCNEKGSDLNVHDLST